MRWRELARRLPLRRFLAGKADAGAAYRYHVSGTRGSLVITGFERITVGDSKKHGREGRCIDQ